MVRLENIRFSYGQKHVLKDTSLEIPDRGVFLITGPSGVGKTTLFRIICGLETPDVGKVICSRPPVPAVLFQEDRLIEHLTAPENVAAVCPRSQAEEWLHKLEIADFSSPVKEFSGGMRRRVALARALAFDGNILLLDEPFRGLDLPLRRRLYPLLLERAQTMPVVAVTHDGEDMEALGGVRFEIK
jgi:ABC-type nitrate/sulfonate/bicarbonate transport system ATPase subunit